MKSHIVTARLRLAALLLLLSGFTAVSAGQEGRPVSVAVNDPRPLASAIQEIERQLGLVITYEEVPWVYPPDVVDVTASVRRDGNSSQRVVIPRGGPFVCSGSLSGETSESQAALLEGVLEQYHAQGYPGRFSLKRTGDRFHVVVSQRRDAKGVFEIVRPMLDVPVTIPTRDRTVATMIQAIVQQVRDNTGGKVYLGLLPMNVLARARVADGAEGESARAVLARTLAAVPRKTSWQLLCAGGVDASCYLSVLPVPGK